MNITRNQWLQIGGVVINACVAASALWTQMFGASTSAIIIGLLGLGGTILSGTTFVLTGQSQQVRDVQAMPGVSQIVVNNQANAALTAVADDPSNTKVRKGA